MHGILAMPPIYDQLVEELKFTPEIEPPAICEFVVVAAMALKNRKNSK